MNVCVIFICFLMFFVGCSSGDSQKSTIEAENEEDDSEEQVTSVYFSNVLKVISTNCSECHGLPVANGAPMSLVSYDDIVESANMIDVRINLDASDPLSMPQNKPNLAQKDKDTILDWIKAGMPNN